MHGFFSEEWWKEREIVKKDCEEWREFKQEQLKNKKEEARKIMIDRQNS